MVMKNIISKNIRMLRKRSGLSQEKLAKKCGMTLRYISYLENAGQNTTIDTLQRLAIALDTSVEELLQDPDKRSSRSPDPKFLLLKENGDKPTKKVVHGLEYAIQILKKAKVEIEES